MSNTDIIIHDEKDNVGVVVIEKITPEQDCNCWIMENDKSVSIQSKDEKTTSTIVNAKDNLGPLSEFILNFSRDLPVFYGLTSVLLAVVLGVGAAMIRRVYSNWDDKRLAKLKR